MPTESQWSFPWSHRCQPAPSPPRSQGPVQLALLTPYPITSDPVPWDCPHREFYSAHKTICLIQLTSGPSAPRESVLPNTSCNPSPPTQHHTKGMALPLLPVPQFLCPHFNGDLLSSESCIPSLPFLPEPPHPLPRVNSDHLSSSHLDLVAENGTEGRQHWAQVAQAADLIQLCSIEWGSGRVEDRWVVGCKL